MDITIEQTARQVGSKPEQTGSVHRHPDIAVSVTMKEINTLFCRDFNKSLITDIKTIKVIIIGLYPQTTGSILFYGKYPVMRKVGVVTREHGIVDESCSVKTAQTIPGAKPGRSAILEAI